MPVISVIVPVYNAEKYLRECLDSIVNQTYKNIEIILVDDGSTDGSGAICDEYADKDVRIKVYHIPNGGVSNARNLGIDNANGEYLMFVDSDDEVSRDCIEKLYCAIEYKEQDLVIGNFCDVYENRKIIQHENLSIIGNLQDDYANIRILLQGPWGKLYRSEILKKNKIRFRVDISLTEDQIFNYDFLKKASTYTLLQEPIYYYYHRKNESLSQGLKERDFNNRLENLRALSLFLDEMKIKNAGSVINASALWYIKKASCFQDQENTYILFKNRIKDIIKYIDFNARVKSFKQRMLLVCLKHQRYILIYLWYWMRTRR